MKRAPDATRASASSLETSFWVAHGRATSTLTWVHGRAPSTYLYLSDDASSVKAFRLSLSSPMA